ncbi:MAG: response regulator [Alphaproteobacteria bacterium]
MKTCLIVDDSRTIRSVARRMIEGLHFATLEAENGAEALSACQAAMPDVILLDWHMPVMNGIEFLRALRQSSNGEHPLVVFCTTENDLTRIKEAIEAGANEFIMKPFDADIIESKFAQVGLI